MNPPDSPAPFPSAGRPLHILYAEDLAQLRELMTMILSHEGHRVETVADGAEALERLAGSPNEFDLLITDHHMPRFNGLELVHRLRQLPFPGKIIVFSSELSQAVYDKYRECAVDLILPKPIFPLTLRRMLNQLFAPDHAAAADPTVASPSPSA